MSLDLLTEVFINQAWKPNLQKLRLSSVNGDPGSVDLYGEKLEEDSRKMKEV